MYDRNKQVQHFYVLIIQFWPIKIYISSIGLPGVCGNDILHNLESRFAINTLLLDQTLVLFIFKLFYGFKMPLKSKCEYDLC